MSRQSGAQILYDQALLRGKRAPAISAASLVEAALSQLLRGSGLTWQKRGDAFLVVPGGSSDRQNQTNRESASRFPERQVATVAARRESAAPAPESDITVTGSRVITDTFNSPTPVVALSAEELDKTTPSTITDALLKMPSILGGQNGFSLGGPVRNSNGTNISLLNLGANRTLVLLDGHRVPPANADGSVNVDVIPTAIIKKVEITTGGSSAVYGSDAITGVVNYILDKKFKGVKFDANAGISNFGDGESWRASVAGGREIFDGRGHIEGAVSYYHRPYILQGDRPYIEGGQQWAYKGLGTAASPYVAIQYARATNNSAGGLITCTGCAANGMQFVTNGVIGPFDKGTATGTNNLSDGGDGGYVATQVGFQSTLERFNAFGRFSYDLSDSATFYVQGFLATSKSYHTYGGNSLGGSFYSTNAFLTPAAQALLASTAGTFSVARVTQQIDNKSANGRTYSQTSTNRFLSGEAGLEGSLWDRLHYDLFYSYAQVKQRVSAIGVNNQKLAAARDAVLDANGKVVCQVSLTASASLYPGCLPINPFGPGAVTQEQFDYVSQKTWYDMLNDKHDVSGSISGDIFKLPAGPVSAALSGEARWSSFRIDSLFSPDDVVDCTGLRLCSAGGLYTQTTVNAIPIQHQAVQEIGGEINVPILKDLPLIKSLRVDAAGRFTHYNTSGSVQTWKAGVMWRLSDELSFRGTRSRDIRAPNLNDLFARAQVNNTTFTDLLTNTAVSVKQTTNSNPDLKPEKSDAWTAGIVLTPSFIPRLTLAVDYYNIKITDGIAVAAYATLAIQQLCIASAPNYDSPFCKLATRPIAPGQPGYTSPANAPTAITSQNVNVAQQSTEGVNVELGYNFPLSAIAASAPGKLSLRLLGTYQPRNDTFATAGAIPSFPALPKGRATLFVNYDVDDWTINIQDTWYSRYSHRTNSSQVFAEPNIKSFNAIDLSISKTFHVAGVETDLYVNVQNLLNTNPPLFISTSGVGYSYPVNRGTPAAAQYRYFTMGLRVRF
nr:TonB-dependent receptor [Sphingomonas sp. dw_22]